VLHKISRNIHPPLKGFAPIGVSQKNYEPIYLINGWSVSFQILLEDAL